MRPLLTAYRNSPSKAQGKSMATPPTRSVPHRYPSRVSARTGERPFNAADELMQNEGLKEVFKNCHR